MLGESVKEHIRRLRLEHAATWLKLSDNSITMIALEAGYESHEAFSRALKSMRGISPSEFCRQKGSQPAFPTGVHYFEEQLMADFRLHNSGELKMEVKIESRTPARMAFVRHIGTYSECAAAWDKLTQEIGRKGLLGGGQDYVAGKLEAQWWGEDENSEFGNLPPEKWHWLLLIRTPDIVDAAELEKAVATLPKRKDIFSMGITMKSISPDPRRVPPERLKTILRVPVRAT